MPSDKGYGGDQKSSGQGDNNYKFSSLNERKRQETLSKPEEVAHAKEVSGERDHTPSDINRKGNKSRYDGSSGQDAKAGSQSHTNGNSEKDLDATWRRRSRATR